MLGILEKTQTERQEVARGSHLFGNPLEQTWKSIEIQFNLWREEEFWECCLMGIWLLFAWRGFIGFMFLLSPEQFVLGLN